MKSSEKPRVKLNIDTHTRIKTWAAAHQTTIERAVDKAIECLVASNAADQERSPSGA